MSPNIFLITKRKFSKVSASSATNNSVINGLSSTISLGALSVPVLSSLSFLVLIRGTFPSIFGVFWKKKKENVERKECSLIFFLHNKKRKEFSLTEWALLIQLSLACTPWTLSWFISAPSGLFGLVLGPFLSSFDCTLWQISPYPRPNRRATRPREKQGGRLDTYLAVMLSRVEPSATEMHKICSNAHCSQNVDKF